MSIERVPRQDQLPSGTAERLIWYEITQSNQPMWEHDSYGYGDADRFRNKFLKLFIDPDNRSNIVEALSATCKDEKKVADGTTEMFTENQLLAARYHGLLTMTEALSRVVDEPRLVVALTELKFEGGDTLIEMMMSLRVAWSNEVGAVDYKLGHHQSFDDCSRDPEEVFLSLTGQVLDKLSDSYDV